jgi:hypothetical protein
MLNAIMLNVAAPSFSEQKGLEVFCLSLKKSSSVVKQVYVTCFWRFLQSDILRQQQVF